MNKEQKIITRKKAIQKIGEYSKYAALTSLATYFILYPKSAQAMSSGPGDGLGDDF